MGLSRKRFFLLVFVIVTCILVFFSIILPIISLELLKKQYLEIMENLNRSETKSGLKALFDRDYNYSELLAWEHERLFYTSERIERYKDPFQILGYGKGRCEEFAILYIALCLAHGYQSRLIVDVYGDHDWAEVYLEGRWVHVDPAERRIGDPYMYERDWKKDLKLVYAFEDGKVEDVTINYKLRK